MFRPLRRTKRAVPEEDAKRLLEMEKRGIFAVNGDDGYPFAIPVNYFYDRENEKIYFHGAKSGHKVDSIRRSDKVCFTVYGNERFEEGDWAPYVTSAVVFGRCRLVDDDKETFDRVRRLAQKYYPNEAEIDEEMARDIKFAQLYEITIENLCGKRIHEK